MWDGLHAAVNKTRVLCQDIQEKYNFRWGKPFLILIISTALTGALMGMTLFLMQVKPLAVFMMNEETRRIYDRGKDIINLNALARSLENQRKQMESLKKSRKSSH